MSARVGVAIDVAVVNWSPYTVGLHGAQVVLIPLSNSEKQLVSVAAR